MSTFGQINTSYQLWNRRQRRSADHGTLRDIERVYGDYFDAFATMLDRQLISGELFKRKISNIVHELWQNTGELLLYRNGRPYYKVLPDFIPPLCNTDLSVPAKYFKLPYSAWEIRLPTLPALNPMRSQDAVVTAIMVADLAAVTTPPLHPRADPHLAATAAKYQEMRQLLGVPPEVAGDDVAIWVQYDELGSHGLPRTAFELTHLRQDKTVREALAGTRAVRTGGPRSVPDYDMTDLDACWGLVLTLSLLITGHDKLIEPDVLSKDLDKFRLAKTPDEIERLHDRATRRRNEGKGYTVGRRERFLSIARQRQAEYDKTGRELQFSHQRACHFNYYHTKAGYIAKWIPQLTVRADLPPGPVGPGRGTIVG